METRPSGGPADYGAKGSIRPDIVIERHVIEPDGQSSWQVVQVYDLKTGARGLPSRWMSKVSTAFGIDKSHIEALRPH